MTTKLIEAFDELDQANDEHAGGPIDSASKVLRSIETEILSRRADTTDALAWKVRRLARAVANDWCPSEAEVIAQSIKRDLSHSDACVR
ncbi:MAG TPA: hypothetical protein VM620_09785 [Hyphomicrobium sp.]|nr:hypothetical protein [Hyphomicrobium sp.]